ncbi:MAG: serine hydrolase [Gemmatimonadaceae bacterium]
MRLNLSVLAGLLIASAVGAQKATPEPRHYPHANEPIGTVRQMYDGALTPDLAVNTFRNIDRLFPTRRVASGGRVKPLPSSSHPLGTISFTDRGRPVTLEQYVELNRVSGLLVLKDGAIALERYRYGNTRQTRWMSMSIAKSITSTLIGAALQQRRIGSLSDSVTSYARMLSGSAYVGVSIRDLLTMSSGVGWNETYTDPASDRRRLLEAQIAGKRGAVMNVMRSLPRVAAPGTVNNYSTGDTQVAAEVVRAATGRTLSSYLSERIWRRYGMEADARWWLDSPGGIEIGGSGFSATLRDYGRFGLFMLDGGKANGTAMLPEGWTREATTPRPLRGGAAIPYGYFWWPGVTEEARRDEAYEAVGIFGQHLYINPAQRIVIVVWSAQTMPTGGEVIDDWAFFDSVARAVR